MTLVETASVSLLVLLTVLAWLWGRRDSFGDIRGPSSSSWFFGGLRLTVFQRDTMILTASISGNTLDLLLPYNYGEYEYGWQKLYGPVYKVKGCFGVAYFQIIGFTFAFLFVSLLEKSPGGIGPPGYSAHPYGNIIWTRTGVAKYRQCADWRR